DDGRDGAAAAESLRLGRGGVGRRRGRRTL
ncbi:MAG: hypothetical protein AVDCRST_MAG49-1885, partial [uncultured Thermomicrobiales bacterium]